jgi:Ribosomal protein L11 methyltransferase (PrmA)
VAIAPVRAIKSSVWSLYKHFTVHTSYGKKAAAVSFNLCIGQRRSKIQAELMEQLRCTVAFGPFAGLLLAEKGSWFDGDITAKLLGCYEQELHPHLLQMLARSPEVIVNVGCADGYYAVGLARLTACPVYAIDIEPTALAACGACANENGVGDRVHVRGDSSSDVLRNIAGGQRGLILIDCEGAEIDLLTPELLPALAGCDLIIESHDFRIAGAMTLLYRRFHATHDIVIVREGSRDPNLYRQLTSLPSLDRWLAICEGRPETMSWLACFARRSEGVPA